MDGEQRAWTWTAGFFAAVLVAAIASVAACGFAREQTYRDCIAAGHQVTTRVIPGTTSTGVECVK